MMIVYGPSIFIPSPNLISRVLVNWPLLSYVRGLIGFVLEVN